MKQLITSRHDGSPRADHFRLSVPTATAQQNVYLISEQVKKEFHLEYVMWICITRIPITPIPEPKAEEPQPLPFYGICSWWISTKYSFYPINII